MNDNFNFAWWFVFAVLTLASLGYAGAILYLFLGSIL